MGLREPLDHVTSNPKELDAAVKAESRRGPRTKATTKEETDLGGLQGRFNDGPGDSDGAEGLLDFKVRLEYFPGLFKVFIRLHGCIFQSYRELQQRKLPSWVGVIDRIGQSVQVLIQRQRKLLIAGELVPAEEAAGGWIVVAGPQVQEARCILLLARKLEWV